MVSPTKWALSTCERVGSWSGLIEKGNFISFIFNELSGGHYHKNEALGIY
jgi:hypothetical protein